MNTSELTRAIEANRFQAFSTFGKVPGGSLVVTDRMITVIPPIQLPAPLCAWIFDAKLSQKNVNEEVDKVIDYFEQRGKPLVWETGPTTRPRHLGRVLKAHGIEHLFDLAGMALDLGELKNHNVPTGLVTQSVDTQDKLRAWAHAFRESFELPSWSESGIVDVVGASWEESGGKWHHYIGTIDETPVASSSMYLHQGIAGIYFVGTVPSARKRGIGTSTTLRALQEAHALGIRVSVLHAAPLAQNLYSRLGFKEYCKLGLYLLKLSV